MVELVAAVCPKCGSKLEFPGDLKIAHCMYCGAKVIIEESKPDVHYHGIGTLENYLELGQLMIEKGHSEKAIEYFNKALEIDAKSIEAWYGRGLADEIVGKYSHALFWYNKVLKINPKHEKILRRMEVWYKKGLEAEREGFKRAIYYYKPVLEINPKHEKILKRLEAMRRAEINRAENILKEYLSELKRLKQFVKFFLIGFSISIVIYLIFPLLIHLIFPSSWFSEMNIVLRLVCTIPLFLVALIISLHLAEGLSGVSSSSHYTHSEEVNRMQYRVSKQREIIDDLKRHPPDKESLKSFIDYFLNYLDTNKN